MSRWHAMMGVEHSWKNFPLTIGLCLSFFKSGSGRNSKCSRKNQLSTKLHLGFKEKPHSNAIKTTQKETKFQQRWEFERLICVVKQPITAQKMPVYMPDMHPQSIPELTKLYSQGTGFTVNWQANHRWKCLEWNGWLSVSFHEWSRGKGYFVLRTLKIVVTQFFFGQ